MATRTISDTGGNWSDPAAWAEGIVPTFADDVVATATSGPLTVDVASNCRSINLTGYISTLINTAQLAVLGEDGQAVDVIFPSTMSRTGNANLSLGYAATGNRTINLVVDIYYPTIVIGLVVNPNLTVNLQSDLVAHNLTVTSGTFRTNNHALDLTAFNAYNSNTKTLDFGSSAITLRYSGGNNALLVQAGGTTVLPNTSIVTFASDGTANVGGLNMQGMSLMWNSNARINNGGTFKDITVIGGASKTGFLNISGTTTIAGTLSVKGNSAINRILIQSYALGSLKTINAANVDFANVDFRDIRGSGAANWNLAGISGGSGDCGGNDRITFTPSQTNYWRGGTGSWSSSTRWGNLVSNPSFDTLGSGGTNYFANWWCSIDDYGSITQDTEIYHSSKASAKIIRGESAGAIVVGNGGSVAVTPGETYTLSFWSYGDGVHNGKYAVFNLTQGGAIVTQTSLPIEAVWNNTTQTFTIPDDCTAIQIVLYAPLSGGSINFDDVCLSRGDTAIYGRVPLPQDDAVFDADSFTAAGQTVTCDMPRIGRNIDWTGAANNPTWASGTLSITSYGSVTLSSGMIVTGTGTHQVEGRGAYTWTSSGVTYTRKITIAAVGGSYTLQDALISTGLVGGIGLQLLNGTFDANDFNVTIRSFNSNESTARTLKMGSGTWVLTGTGYAWNVYGVIALHAENSTIIIADTSAVLKRFYSYGTYAYNNLVIPSGGDGIIVFDSDTSSQNTVNRLTINAPKIVQLTSGSVWTVKEFIARGTSGNLITISTTTSGSPATLSKQVGITACNYLSLKDIAATGGAMWFAGKQSTDAGGNGGWIFETYTPPTMLD